MAYSDEKTGGCSRFSRPLTYLFMIYRTTAQIEVVRKVACELQRYKTVFPQQSIYLGLHL